MTKPAKIARQFLRDREALGGVNEGVAQLAALLAITDAIDRNTAALLEDDPEPASTDIEYNIDIKPDFAEKIRERIERDNRRYTHINANGRNVPITGSASGSEGVKFTADTPYWTSTPTVVASKDGDKPIDPESAEHKSDGAFRPEKISPVGLAEGADVNTPPRTEREVTAAIAHDAEEAAIERGYRRLADGDTARNVIIGASVEDVTLFKSHNRRYAMWHTIYPGAETRLKGVTEGEWIATPEVVSRSYGPSLDPAVESLVQQVSARQGTVKPVEPSHNHRDYFSQKYGTANSSMWPTEPRPAEPSSGYNHNLGKYATGGLIPPNPGTDSILNVIETGYRLTSDQVKAWGSPILAKMNAAAKPNTDIDTTAGKLNAEHLGRTVSLHSVEQTGKLTSIELTDRLNEVVTVELDDASTWVLNRGDAVTVHTDYPNITIGDEA